MEELGYLRIFRERWVALAVGVLVGLAASLGVSAAIRPVYTATATSFLSVQSDTGSLIERSQFALARISSYPALATSSDVLQQTISDLGLHVSQQQLSSVVSASNPPTTVLLQITARDENPRVAAEIANSVSENLSNTVSSLENSGTDDRYDVSLEVRDKAQSPIAPTAPQRGIILGLGLLGGLALGLIAAIIWARLDRTIRKGDDARRVSGLPVIGEIPGPTIPFGRQRANRAEHEAIALREALLAIRQANGGEMPRFLALVPASRTAGELNIRIGLARSLAATGRSTLLLEADYRGGVTQVIPEAQDRDGLAELLAGASVTKDFEINSEDESFTLIPAGQVEHAPKQKAAESAIRRLVARFVLSYDTTLIQVTSISDPVPLELVVPYADGVVVTARSGRTTEPELAHTLARLRLLGVRPLGIVLIGVPRYRRTDLIAAWQPGDFNETPRNPVRSWSERNSPVFGVQAQKAPPYPRVGAADPRIETLVHSHEPADAKPTAIDEREPHEDAPGALLTSQSNAPATPRSSSSPSQRGVRKPRQAKKSRSETAVDGNDEA